MHKTLLICEVASFAKDVSTRGAKSGRHLRRSEALDSFQFDAHGVTHAAADDGESAPSGEASLMSTSTKDSNPKLLDTGRRDRLTGSLTSSQKVRIIQLLESWEEPTLANKKPVCELFLFLSFCWRSLLLTMFFWIALEQTIHQRRSTVSPSPNAYRCVSSLT